MWARQARARGAAHTWHDGHRLEGSEHPEGPEGRQVPEVDTHGHVPAAEVTGQAGHAPPSNALVTEDVLAKMFASLQSLLVSGRKLLGNTELRWKSELLSTEQRSPSFISTIVHFRASAQRRNSCSPTGAAAGAARGGEHVPGGHTPKTDLLSTVSKNMAHNALTFYVKNDSDQKYQNASLHQEKEHESKEHH